MVNHASRIVRGVLALTMMVGLTAVVGSVLSTSAAGASAPKGSPIVLGNVSTDTGTQAFPGYDDAVPATLQAWSSWTNAHGGINGHPVKVITLDDKGDPAQSVADATTLIKTDHVVALIGINDPGLDPNWAAIAQKAGVPVIGGNNDTINPWSVNPDFFPQTSLSLAGDAEVFPLLGHSLGAKTFGTVLCTLSACSEFVPLLKAAAPTVGMKFTYGALAPMTAPNHTSYCLAAQAANTQSILPSGIAVGQFVTNCNQAGYNPIYILGPTDIYNAYLSSLSTAKEAAAPGPDFPYFYKGPQTADYRAALKQYANVPTALQGETQAVDWVSGLMVQKAVQLSGVKGLPTSADIKNGLYKFKNQTLGGLATPLTFVRSTTNSPMNSDVTPQCFFVISADKGKLKAPHGLKVTCGKPVKS